MEPTITERVCGHRYRAQNGIEYICRLDDHPRKPTAHYYSKNDDGVSPARLESTLEEHFRRLVIKLGGASFKLTVGGGCPDRMVLLPFGHIYLVELKAVTGELSPAQVQWHRRASLMGITVYTLTGKADVDLWAIDRASEIESERANR